MGPIGPAVNPTKSVRPRHVNYVCQISVPLNYFHSKKKRTSIRTPKTMMSLSDNFRTIPEIKDEILPLRILSLCKYLQIGHNLNLTIWKCIEKQYLLVLGKAPKKMQDLQFSIYL